MFERLARTFSLRRRRAVRLQRDVHAALSHEPRFTFTPTDPAFVELNDRYRSLSSTIRRAWFAEAVLRAAAKRATEETAPLVTFSRSVADQTTLQRIAEQTPENLLAAVSWSRLPGPDNVATIDEFVREIVRLPFEPIYRLPDWIAESLTDPAMLIPFETRLGWAIHLASGERLRDLVLPVVLSRRGRRLIVASGLGTLSDLRIAQLRAAGLAKERATAIILESRLGDNFDTPERESFLVKVFAWLASHPDVAAIDVDKVVDHALRRRFDVTAVWREEGTLGQRTGDPRYTLSGASAEEVFARMRRDRFESEQAYAGLVTRLNAEAMQIDVAGRRFVMVPLLTETDFEREGEEMSNCVGDYFFDGDPPEEQGVGPPVALVDGQPFVWSLREVRNGDARPQPRVTVHVAGETICEYAGKADTRPRADEMAALRLWAVKRQLTL